MKKNKGTYMTIEREIPEKSAIIHRETFFVGYFPMSEIRPKENKITEKTSVFATLGA